MEITPSKYRGAAGTLHQIAVAFSELLSLLFGIPEVFGSKQLWPIAFGCIGLPALFLCISLPFSPESPKFLLVSRGRHEEAKKALHRLVNNKEAQLMFEELLKEAAMTRVILIN
jgi:SP family facilitated glucose transporter-like MFS transporter 1